MVRDDVIIQTEIHTCKGDYFIEIVPFMFLKMQTVHNIVFFLPGLGAMYMVLSTLEKVSLIVRVSLLRSPSLAIISSVITATLVL